MLRRPEAKGRPAVAPAKPAEADLENPSEGQKSGHREFTPDTIGEQAVEIAAHWLAAHRDVCPRPVVVALRRRFRLSPLQACQALAQAEKAP